MDEVVDWFADKDARGKLWPEQFVAIGRRAVAGGDVIGLGWIVETLQRAAAGKAARGIFIIGQHLLGGLNRQVRVAGQVLLRQVVVPQPRRIVIPKPVSPVVPMAAILGLARHGLETQWKQWTP